MISVTDIFREWLVEAQSCRMVLRGGGGGGETPGCLLYMRLALKASCRADGTGALGEGEGEGNSESKV